MANVAFIGTGIMGLPMAGHLIAAGNGMRIHTRTKRRCQGLLDRGARWCDSPAAAVADAEFVFICVPDTPDVKEIITGKRGILSSAKQNQVVIDHSTISPLVTRELAEQLSKSGAFLLDAPLSGGDVGAKNATLSIMVGGEPHAFERAEPLLRCMGKTITYCGPSGCGQLTKLVNQILVSGTLLAVAEALTFANKSGLNAKKTIEAVSGGAATSWQLQNLGPKMVANDFRPGFMIDLLQKDLRILMQTADQIGTSLPGAALVHQLFTAAQAAGHGREGTQALYTVIEKLSSLH
ncbi:MAG TPA: NAD(P)-dependent oxidoreductase [Tepidisphaeraceae bacterium]